MRRTRVVGWHFLLWASCILSAVSAQPPSNIFERQSTCADPSFSPCTQAGVPSGFCCGASQNCILLAAATTVLCCPDSATCDTIQPITCDITQQNATLHPNNALKTTALGSQMETCGGQCCPFGYSCNSQDLCDKNADQSVPPPAASTSATPSTTAPFLSPTSLSPSSASAASLTPTGSSQALTSVVPNTASCQKTCNRFPTGAILVGFFPGMFLGAVLTAAALWCASRRHGPLRRRSTSSSFGNTISEPQPFTDMRSDFLRKPPQTPSTLVDTAPARQSTIKRVRSLFRKSVNSDNGSPMMSTDPTVPVPPLIHKHLVGLSQHTHVPARPVTPPLQREPSYEDISIFADGNTASALRAGNRNDRLMRASHQTTFTDMMEQTGLAGVTKGQRK